MPKRKLSEFADAPAQNQPPNQLKLQKTRLKQKFEFGVTTLSGALKTARGFERQKLGRRQKTAKNGPHEEEQKRGKGKVKKPKGKVIEGEEALKRIEGEIAVLKNLDLSATAEKYIFKQLLKTKRITEAPVFIRFRQSKKISIEGPKCTEEANVTARLFKSNPVQKVLPGIMDGLRELIGVEAGETKKEKPEKKDSQSVSKIEKAAVRPDPDVSGESKDEAGSERDVDMEDADSDEEDYAQFDGRLASDSEDEDGSPDYDEATLAKLKSLPPRSDISISLSPSASPEPESPPQKKPKASTKADKTPATNTTFLPSLMMGGYWSGSESEAEELEEAPRRKNRMGQQARRALWEKKYGAGANHVKEGQNKKGKGRDSGWDPRKGATDGDGARRKFGTGSNAMAMGTDKRTGAQRGPGTAKKPQDDKPLHPSWEAARKAKEQKTTAAFQGKKVVFD